MPKMAELQVFKMVPKLLVHAVYTNFLSFFGIPEIYWPLHCAFLKICWFFRFWRILRMWRFFENLGKFCTGRILYPGGFCASRILYREDFLPGRILYREDFVPGGFCARRILCREDFVPGGFCTREDFVPGGKWVASLETISYERFYFVTWQNGRAHEECKMHHTSKSSVIRNTVKNSISEFPDVIF